MVGCSNNLFPSKSEQLLFLPNNFQENSLNLEKGELQVFSKEDNDEIVFTLKLGRFKTQALDFTSLKYLKMWVVGSNIKSQIENEKGFVQVESQLQEVTLTIKNIPQGKNRVVTAQAYDQNKTPISGMAIKVVYSSLNNGNRIRLTLKWNTFPTGKILERLFEINPNLAVNVESVPL